MKKLLCLVFVSLLLLGQTPVSVSAKHKYEVFVDGGLYGDVEKVSDVPDGALLGFGSIDGVYQIYDQDTAAVYYRISSNDDKYYVKGIHVSGHLLDPDEILDNSDELTADEDLYLVASFGVKGDTYEYRVYYYTEGGTNLKTSAGEADEYDSFHAYKDEKVIVAPRSFDGYEDYIVYKVAWKGENADGSPVEGSAASRGLTYTIKDDLRQIMTIEYTYRKVDPGEVVTYDESVIYLPGTGGGTGGGGGGGTSPVTPEPETEPIVDIDQPEVPTTEPEVEPHTDIKPEPVPESNFWETFFAKPWLVAGSGLALFMLLFFLVYLLRRRKRDGR